MLENFANVSSYNKFNRITYFLTKLSCLFSKIRYACFPCVLNFFLDTNERHCRDPPSSFRKNEMNRRKEKCDTK